MIMAQISTVPSNQFRWLIRKCRDWLRAPWKYLILGFLLEIQWGVQEALRIETLPQNGHIVHACNL